MFLYHAVNFLEGSSKLVIELMNNYEVRPFSMRLRMISYAHNERLKNSLLVHICHNLMQLEKLIPQSRTND